MGRIGLFIVIALVVPVQANAWFFFIPGGAIEAVSDALTGSEGNNCVASTGKVGDMIALSNGGVGKIKSLSGTSTRCTNPEYPIRALLETVVSAAIVDTKARLDLPDGWETKTLTDRQRASGTVFYAVNRTIDSGVMLSVAKREGITDMDAYVSSRRSAQVNWLDNTVQSEISRISIGGLPGWRFNVTGAVRSGAHQQFTYLITILEGATEVIIINVWTSAAAFDSQRANLERVADGIREVVPPIQSIAVANRRVDPSPSTEPPMANLAEIPPAKQESGAGSSAAPTNPAGTTAQRLRELNAVYKEGLIDQKEYEERKRKILDSI